MFNLPSIEVGDIPRFADWVELCTLCGDDPIVSSEWAGDVIKDAGLIGHEPGDLPPGDDPYGEDDLDFSSDDQVDTCTDLVWEELARRQRHGGYPFWVRHRTIRRLSKSWTDAPAFTMLLIADIGRHYSTVGGVELTSDGATGAIFEGVTTAACQGLFGSRSVRFGWPRSPGWPTGIDDRIRHLGEELGVYCEDLSKKTHPHDKDKTLDVASLMSAAGSSDAMPAFLIQCAVGRHWRTKRGEPNEGEWCDLLQWQGPLVRGVAVPWRLEGYKKLFRHFGRAVILDRPRLNSGFPDRFLPSEVSGQIVKWCAPLLSQFPRL